MNLKDLIISKIYNSPIGGIEIISSDDKIIGIHFGQKYETKFQKSIIIDQCIEELNEYFSGKRKLFNVNINYFGTDFQRKVWSELLNIKYGETCSYKKIANLIGNPGAMRAVGNANNKNKIAIIIPCHRVIGADGKLVGYAGELWRKEWLLNHENKFKDK